MKQKHYFYYSIVLLLFTTTYSIAQNCGTFIKISAGHGHTMAIKNDGTLWAWGNNYYGQLGENTMQAPINYPIQVGAETNWTNVSAGFDFNIALKTNGTIWSWGENLSGHLGYQTPFDEYNIYTPTQIAADTDWTDFDISESNGIIHKNNNTIWLTGMNGAELALTFKTNTTEDNNYLYQFGTDADWSKIAVNYNHFFAIKTNGTLWGFGLNESGQLGDGTTDPLSNFLAQIGTDTDWANISVGGSYSIGMKTNGTLWAWGNNTAGQLGNGTTNASNVPMQIGTDTNWVNVQASGSNSTIGLKSDGTL